MRAKRKLILLCLSTLAVLMVCSISANLIWGSSTGSDLDARIAILQSQVNALTIHTNAAFAKLKAETNMTQGALLVGAIVTAHPGDTVSWPITLIPSQFSVASLQADFLVPVGLSFISATVGPAATAANKQLSISVSTGTDRALLFGLNQTLISEGVIVVLTLKVDANAAKRFYPVMLDNPAISDAKGNAVMVSAVSGTVVVN